MKTGVFDCGIGDCSSFDIELTFTGSGNNDTYALNSRFTIVPIPSTILLLGAGIIAFAGYKRKFRKK